MISINMYTRYTTICPFQHDYKNGNVNMVARLKSNMVDSWWQTDLHPHFMLYSNKA